MKMKAVIYGKAFASKPCKHITVSLSKPRLRLQHYSARRNKHIPFKMRCTTLCRCFYDKSRVLPGALYLSICLFRWWWVEELFDVSNEEEDPIGQIDGEVGERWTLLDIPYLCCDKCILFLMLEIKHWIYLEWQKWTSCSQLNRNWIMNSLACDEGS